MATDGDSEGDGEQQEDDQTRFVDELGPIYDILDNAVDEAETQRETAVIMMMKELADYARAVGLQREFPTPNQKLNAACRGREPEKPDDPGHWREYVENSEDWQEMVDWTHPPNQNDDE